MPLDKLLGSANGSAALSGALSGVAGGAVVSALTNKKSAKKLLKTGGLVALGGVAWHAFQKYRDTTVAAVVEPSQDQSQLSQAHFDAVVAEPSRAGLLVEAMIAAGYADGHLTEMEQRRIWQQAVEQGMSAADLADLKTQLAKPTAMPVIIARADNLQTKIEVYSASLLVIDVDCVVGQNYLAELAQGLELPQPLIEALHASSVT